MGKKGGKGKKEKVELVVVHKHEKRWKRVLKPDKTALPLTAFKTPGVVTIVLSKLAQENLQCIVTEDVTSQIPWKWVPKELILGNLELFGQTSEFFPYKTELTTYPRDKIFMCYKQDDLAEDHEFYLCLTVEVEDSITEVITNIMEEREKTLKKTVYKTARPWTSWGSENEVYDMNDHNQRKLLLVELEMKFPLTRHPASSSSYKLRMRPVEDSQDGYVEILSTRTTFQNLSKIRLHASVQASGSVRDNWSQTYATYNLYPDHKYCQYFFEYGPPRKPTKSFEPSIKRFMSTRLIEMDEMLYINSNINLHTHDYVDLVSNSVYARETDQKLSQPFSFILDTNYCKGKEITSLSWHPLWTCIAAVAYSNSAPSNYRKFKHSTDEVIDAMYNTVPVLLWSLGDIVEPKLLLETPRKVSFLEFCPYNENILVGGCVNGQILIWDITQRLEKVETSVTLTAAHHHYRMLMNSLSRWFKRLSESKFVRTTVVSDLAYSHTSAVTGIAWINPFQEITSTGKINNIPPKANRTSMQFITTSRDGSLCFWDLFAHPQYSAAQRPKRKLQRLKKRPSALTLDVSPFRILNRVMRPVYKINIFAPGTTRPLPISKECIRYVSPIFEEISPNSHRKFDIRNRIKFRAHLQPPLSCEGTEIVVGSTEGDIIVGSWEGFDFNSGAEVNTENLNIKNCGKYHDGPITSLSRSTFIPELILVTGGKVFSLWMTNFLNKPIMWKRSQHRYTHGVWNTYRPSIFRLTKSDGSLEYWQLSTRSNDYINSQILSGNSITASYTHPLPLGKIVTGIGDANGTLRLHYMSSLYGKPNLQEQNFIKRMVEREVSRKNKTYQWQNFWIAKYIKGVAEVKNEEKGEIKQKDTGQAVQLEEKKQEPAAGGGDQSTSKQKEPKGDWERNRKRVIERELQITQRAVLKAKRLDKNLLMKKQQPLLNVQKEENKLRERLRTRLEGSQRVYDEAIRTVFPEAVQKKPLPPPDPYAGGDMELQLEQFEKYREISEDCEDYISSKPYQYRFNWKQVTKSGKERKKFLYGRHNEYNHKKRFENEQQEKDEQSEGMLEKFIRESDAAMSSLGSNVNNEDDVLDKEEVVE